jgi:Heterokaryon incompatibility protein (HET)
LLLTVPSATTPISLDSEQSYRQARRWIEACKNHDRCRREPGRSREGTLPAEAKSPWDRIPRHLIQVNHEDGPRIVPHRSLPERARYVALSYVWGGNQTYVLTKNTLQAKCSGLDLGKVPKTIVDAMNVTRELSYSFLWVDALCIIQDDADNMAAELASMGAIYRDSEVTIIAASASRSADGFVGVPQSPSHFVNPFEISLSTKDESDVLLSVGYRSYYKPFKDPINARAWTLQERLLSTRCLQYSYDGLKWICQTCEKNPSAPPDAPSMFPRMALLNNHNEPSSTESQTDVHRTWLDIRAEYTQRSLTNGVDKLPAISAIAAEIAKITGWSYVAGLWKEHLFSDLLWRSDVHTSESSSSQDINASLSNPLRPRPAKYRAPSWSWASIDGAVVDLDDEFDNREVFHFHIVTCDIEYTTAVEQAQFPFASIKSGTLVAEGRVIESDWRWADPKIDDPTLDAELLDPDENWTYIWGDVLFDASEPSLTPGIKLFCLAMSVLKSNRTRWPIEGLVLLPETTQRAYRRVGIFQTYATAPFDGIPERLVTII